MDQNNNGPTAFDLSKPLSYGAAPPARPTVANNQPTAADPMFAPTETLPQSGSIINVKVNESPFSSAAIEPETGPASPFTPAPGLAGTNQTQASIGDQQISPNKPKPSVFGGGGYGSVPKGDEPKYPKRRKKLWLIILGLLVAAAGVYGAIDKGLIFGNVNLPYHIFEQTSTTISDSPSTSPSPQLNVPTGFAATKLVEANLTFAYPAAWGAPTASIDQGFIKRSSAAKADSSYAFIVDFPDNKDVQLAITSGKFLPPSRGVQYYDYLSWCLGTVDANYYVGALHFSTSDGTDTPTTASCDQGPLNNAAKLSSDTIVQTNLKNTDGTQLGNLYTRNLKNNDYEVARVKDVTMKNGDQIQTMLASIQNIQ